MPVKTLLFKEKQMSYTNYNHSFRRSRLSEPSQMTSDANIWTPTVDQKHMLGAIYDTDDGRRFRYQKNGSGALTIANVAQQAVETANWVDEIQTNNPLLPSVGDTLITVTMATTAAKDELSNTILWVEQGTGVGSEYRVKGNRAGTANATSGFDVVFELADASGLRIAYVAASNISVKLNTYEDVIVFPTDPTGVATGVCKTAVTAAWYFWGQTKGECVVMNGSDSIVTGDEVCVGGQAAGVLSLPDAATPQEGDVTVGYVIRAAASGEAALIYLTIE